MQHHIDELNAINQELRNKLQNLKTRSPEAFCCPITGEIMMEPVVASDGYT